MLNSQASISGVAEAVDYGRLPVPFQSVASELGLTQGEVNGFYGFGGISFDFDAGTVSYNLGCSRETREMMRPTRESAALVTTGIGDNPWHGEDTRRIGYFGQVGGLDVTFFQVVGSDGYSLARVDVFAKHADE